MYQVLHYSQRGGAFFGRETQSLDEAKEKFEELVLIALDKYVKSMDEIVFDKAIKRTQVHGYPFDNAVVTKLSDYCYKIVEEDLSDRSNGERHFHEQKVLIREIQINELL